MWAASILVAFGMVTATAYSLLAAEPYRALPDATVLAAKGQDVASLLVAGLLVVLVRPARVSPRCLLLWLGLMAYVAYTYSIYLIGVPMNRVFLVYVVLVSVAGGAVLAGLWRVAGTGWADAGSPGLWRGTAWMLLVVAVLFAGLWLSTLLPFALGGRAPSPEGVGGTPYPVFVLDLVVVLPSIAVVGWLLLRHHRLGSPLAVIALTKILSLFLALWTGPAFAVVTDGPLSLGPDAGPSLVMLALSGWLLTRWWRALAPEALATDRTRTTR